MNEKLIHSRKEIIDLLTKELAPEIINKEISMSYLCAYSAHALSEGYIDVELSSEISKNVDIDELNINAYYDRLSDADNDTAVGIVFLHNEANEDRIVLDEVGTGLLIIRMADAITHEFIHARQHRARDFMRGQNGITLSTDKRTAVAQEYLSRPDEIEAYGYNIASELLVNLEDNDTVYEYLKLCSKAAGARDKIGNLISPNMYGIMSIFEYNTELPNIRKLLKQTYKYVNVICNE